MKKKIPAIIPALVISGLFISGLASAQSLNAEDIKSQMIKEWERAKVYTEEYLNTMPADKFGYKPNDSVRNFAQQMLHLASGNVFLMSNATGQNPTVNIRGVEGRNSAWQKDSVAYYVNASYDYCINAVKNTPPESWGEMKKIFGTDLSKYALMIKTFEHQTHHRGQTTMYIRQLGIKPPQEKLF